MRPRAGSDAFLIEALSRKGAKELQRLERRLAETGKLEYAALEDPGRRREWIADFLELEARGWKGRNASALGSSDAGRLFFIRASAPRRGADDLMMLGLRLAGRWIALKCNFVSGEGSFAFKIAYDEDYAKFSPGTLLELENIRRFHARPELRWMDSCADPGHFMVNRLWPDRRALADLVSTTGRAAGDLMVSSLPLLHWVSRNLREPARRLDGRELKHEPLDRPENVQCALRRCAFPGGHRLASHPLFSLAAPGRAVDAPAGVAGRVQRRRSAGRP